MKGIPNFQTNDIYARVCTLVDNQLSPEESQILLAEINSNPEYLKIYEQEKKFKAFIKKHATPAPRKAPAALIEALKAQIHLEPHHHADAK